MIITKKALPRRTFLRGTGVALALPLLDAMIPSFSDAAAVATPVRRLGFVYIPMGCNWFQFFPKEVGTLTELPPTLSTLAPVMNQVTVISNLELKNSYSPGNHATSNAGFLSCARAKMTEGADYELATTVDQIAAKQFAKETRLPSLELAMDLTTPIGACDGGMSCIYETSLSWSSPTTPLPAEANPRVVFERLFGDGGSAADQLAALREDGSLIDLLSENITHIQKKLGPGDRTKLSQYLDSVREIERRLQKAETQTANSTLPDLDPKAVLPALTAYYLMRVGRTALVPYYRPGDAAVADAIRGLAGRYASVLLANHGPVVAGASLEAAVFAIEELEETAKLYLLLRGLNPRYLSPAQVKDLAKVFGLELPEHGHSHE